MLDVADLKKMVNAAIKERQDLQSEYREYAVPNPDNKMSPYRPVKSKQLNTVSDWINYYQFRAWYTQNYTPAASEFLSGDLNPIYAPVKGEERAYGALTISGMLDLLDMGESFTLEKTEDMSVIKRICLDYLKEVPTENLNINETNIINRIKNLVKLLDDSMVNSTRVVNIHSLLRKIVR